MEEAAKRNKQQQKKRECTVIDMETESLLQHDALNRDYGGGGGNGNNNGCNEQQTTEIVPTRIPRIPMKYTTSATLHVGKTKAWEKSGRVEPLFAKNVLFS